MSIIPQTVFKRYIEVGGYKTAADITNIEDALRTAKSRIIQPALRSADRGITSNEFILTAGASGGGKSHRLREVVATAPENSTPVLLDATALLQYIDGFHEERAQAEGFFEGTQAEATLEGLRGATQRWHLASMYMRDRLVNVAAEHKLPVALETSAHTPHIATLFNNIRAAGYSINLQLCEAPLAVKMASNQHRFENEVSEYVSPKDVERKDADVLNNLPLFAMHADKMSILWRDDPHAPSRLIAEFADHGGSIVDEKGVAEFNRDRCTKGPDIAQLMSSHRDHRAMRAKGRRRVLELV